MDITFVCGFLLFMAGLITGGVSVALCAVIGLARPVDVTEGEQYDPYQ